jgi:hypothetical protein
MRIRRFYQQLANLLVFFGGVTLSSGLGGFMKTLFKTITILPVVGALAVLGCGKSGGSYSLLSDSNTFSQSSVSTQQQKIDILWVVDNSGSMSPFQQNLVQNFQSFIQNFSSKGLDFHIAVTTTDAYLALPQFLNDSTRSVFPDGVGSTHSGYPIIDVNTPNLMTAFTTNASQGANGDGDERAFSSMKAALQNSANSAFKRDGSFLAVIILSDEDDFSDPNRPEASWLQSGGIPDHDYNDPGLETVASYMSFLDSYTGTTNTADRQYNVSAVTVLDNTCLNSHISASPSTIIGQRYISLANQTNGVTADICSASYASALDAIQKQIIELSTQFRLSRLPVVSSIVVTVNGVVVAQDATNGWTYNSTVNSIVFHGTAIPAQGASINVAFDPQTVNE